MSKVIALAGKVEIPAFQPKKLQIETVEENRGADGNKSNQAVTNPTFSGLSLSGGGGDDEAQVALLEQQLLAISESKLDLPTLKN